MAEVNKYQDSILKVLEEYKGRFKKTSKDIQALIVADKENHHYQLLWLGWDGKRHIFTVTAFLSIINGKIWVQHDSTEAGIANMLVEEGILKTDIVLGYFPSDHRALTEFAAA